jgi:hypothetical protein
MDMLKFRIVTASAVLAIAVSTAAAQDNDAPGQPGSLLKMLMHSSEATAAPQDKPEAKPVSPKPIRTVKHLHHHATRVATATEDPAPPSETASPPAMEQTPTLEPTSWSAQAAIDAAPASMWPAGNAPIFAGVLDSEPQVAAAAPSVSTDQNATTSNAVADPPPVVVLARQDDSDDSRDVWFEEILATLGGALAAGAVAWFVFGAAPQRRYGHARRGGPVR